MGSANIQRSAKNTTFMVYYALIFILVIMASCAENKTKTFKIGFSQCTSDDLWRQTMNREMQRTVMFYDDLSLVIKDAKGNSQLQVKQIQELMDEKCDLLIISPNESTPITPIAVEIYQKGIPVVLVDRKIDGSDYSAFIGGDNYQIGFKAGEYIAKNHKSETRIMEVWGLKGSSPASERHQGFIDAIAQYPYLNIAATVYGNWLGDEAFKAANSIPPHINIDVVFAHNDVMAKGAKEALINRTRPIEFIGIDALPGKNGGTQMVIDGVLTASFLYPTGGKQAIETANNILHKLPYHKLVLLPTTVIDSSNAREIQYQYTITNSYMEDIDKQQQKLDTIASRYANLQILNSTIIFILLAILILAIISVRAYKIRNLANRKLQDSNSLLSEKNQYIEKQATELLKQKEQLTQINATKDKLFSILAHDLRNPFHAITGFSQLVIEDFKNLSEEEIISYLEIIFSSSKKGSDLLENILQWSRLQTGRLKLQPEEVYLYKVVDEIMSLFEADLVRKKISINYQIDKTLKATVDLNMINTIFRNLISNAIKFTPNQGQISIIASTENTPMYIEIAISDSGIGIPDENLNHLFDMNKTISTQGTDHETGTGLGLKICKEFIERHKGKIWVESTLNKGTTFFFTLPICF